jgi:hypothetical protein
VAFAIGLGLGTAINESVIEALTPDNYNLGDAICDLVDCDEPDFDVPAPPGTDLDDGSTGQRASFDPNDIIGPAGFGPEQFVQADSSLVYTIRFENLAAATAAAQTVVVTQTLDPDLDLATFELLNLGFGEGIVNLRGRPQFLLAPV